MVIHVATLRQPSILSHRSSTATHQKPAPYGGPEPGDILGTGWEGKTVVNRAVADACRPDEWLLVEAWDES